MNELGSELFRTFFRSKKSFKTKKLCSFENVTWIGFFSAKNIWKSDLWFCSQMALGKLFHTLVSTLCWYWPECHIFFAKSESSNEGYDRGNRNNWILGIRIDNSVTWHRLNFRSFGLSIAVISVFWFWVFLYNYYFAVENVFFKFQKDFGRGWF